MGIIFPNWSRTWSGRFVFIFIALAIFSGEIVFLFISFVIFIFTIVWHKFFVARIRKKYGDDLFNLDTYEIREVQVYYSTLTNREREQDKEYILRMVERSRKAKLKRKKKSKP
jgi:hypothetical protein